MKDEYIVRSEKIWNTIARSFDETRQKPWNQCIEFIDRLSETDIVLDIGCGNGRHLLPCAERCSKVIGLDISMELLRIVEKKIINRNIGNVDIIHSDSTLLPLKNNSVNAILYIASLHNIETRERRIQSLKELSRVLREGGIALISVWSRWQDKYRKQLLKKWFIQKNMNDFGDIDICWKKNNLNILRFYHLYGKREFIKDIKEGGLKILEIKEIKINSKKHSDNYFAIISSK